MKTQTHFIPRRAVAVLAVLMVLATATALAVGIHYSRRVEVKRIAREAVMQAYGLDGETLALFGEHAEEAGGAWIVTYHTELRHPMGEYTVTVQPDGSAKAVWSLEGEEGAWGQKELTAFLEQKLTEYRQMQADHSMNALSTAEPIPLPTSVPGARLTQPQAIQAADEKLIDVFGFSARALSAFKPEAGYENGMWTVVYSANEWHWPDGMLSEKAGTYTVTVKDASGEALQAAWSLEGRESRTVTRETLGTADVYDAQCMEWVQELRAEHEEVYTAYEEVPGHLPVEEVARLDGLMVAAGFDPARYNHVLPEGDDMSYEQAVELTAQALQSQYGVSREVFDASVLAYGDLTQQAEGRQWYFWVQNQQLLCSWTVVLDARTGEILDMTTDTLASSNG